MIIDAHAHVWPDSIAARMVAARPAGMDALGDGTVDGLLGTMDSAGIDRACALGVATVGRTVRRTNEFIGSLDRNRFIPFGTIHTDLTVEENLCSLRESGIVGVKFHPNFQQLSLTDPAVLEIMTALADQGLPVLTHAGAGADAAATDRGSPRRVVELAEKVPHLSLIACHFGGYHLFDEAQATVVRTRVVLETSWPPAVGALDGNRVGDLIRAHGVDRVVFGSDWPMSRPGDEILTVRGWGLSADEEAAVLGGNLMRLLDLA